MSYIINNSRGEIVAVVPDGTVNVSATDLALVGRAVLEYGVYENENYIFLLENFANSTAPTQPILGQLWYNSTTDVISAYNSGNTFTALASEDYVQLQKISPVFTGVPVAPTAAAGTATTQLATTAFVTNSPVFTGVPTAPTAATATSTTQLATTAFVTSSPAFTGVPVAPTAATGTSTTQLATTAFVTSSPACKKSVQRLLTRLLHPLLPAAPILHNLQPLHLYRTTKLVLLFLAHLLHQHLAPQIIQPKLPLQHLW